jgi:hypothetical protein
MKKTKSSGITIKAKTSIPIEPKFVSLSENEAHSRNSQQEHMIEHNADPVARPIGRFRPINKKGKAISVEETRYDHDQQKR